MASILLRDVCLDYINKGSDSLKNTVLHAINKILPLPIKPLEIKEKAYRALNNINLEVNKGDKIGLLGRNGAGKSTLLKVLAKIYKPNSGSMVINGKISSLFDVNLGMNLDATGYENIINLAILRGFSKKESQRIIPDVESFTELGSFLNNPVRTYSAGMQMKLAFAVATTCPPEIMLIDEVIGVGDIHFLEKATARIKNLIEQSHLLVLTSHSNDIIKKFCNKVIVLEAGEIRFKGPVDKGIDFYLNNKSG